jgi:methylmalonyl-CoA/ethylmalonyl-CoA epimerase
MSSLSLPASAGSQIDSPETNHLLGSPASRKQRDERVDSVSMAHETSLTLDHVCLAVRRLASACAVIERVLGYRARTDPVENERQQVIVQFLSKPGSIDIKLIEPSSPEAPLVDFIRRTGGGLHHLAFRTDSVDETVGELQGRGARLTAPPQAGAAFNDSPIAFLYVGAGLSVELIETDERASQR